MLKCLRRILEMRAGLYVTKNGTKSLEALGLVCSALVREILAARRNCFSREIIIITTSKEICFKFSNAMFKLSVCRGDTAEAEG